MDSERRTSKSYNIFRNTLLKASQPLLYPVYRVHNPYELKLLTRLKHGLIHLNEQRFNHIFNHALNTESILDVIVKC